MIPRSRRNLCSFYKENNTSTKADRSHAGGVLHAKEGLGRGGGAHREWCSVGERGNGKVKQPGRELRELWSLEGLLSPLSR